MEAIRRKYIGNFVGILSYMSVVIITFCTVYYNEFDSNMYSLYHIITQAFGVGFLWSVSWLVYAYIYTLPTYGVASLICLVIYSCLNVGYSILSISMGQDIFQDVFPTIESFSTLVFGSVCTWYYVKSYLHGV